MRYRLRPYANDRLAGCWTLVEAANGTGEVQQLLFRRRDLAQAFVRAGGFTTEAGRRLAELRLRRRIPPEILDV